MTKENIHRLMVFKLEKFQLAVDCIKIWKEVLETPNVSEQELKEIYNLLIKL